jgi:hypothetical protein
MKVSNLGEVGQIRRSNGISMNMMMKAETLQTRSVVGEAHNIRRGDAQAYDAKRNDKGCVEDVCDSEREAKEDAQHSGPDNRSVMRTRSAYPKGLSIVVVYCRAAGAQALALPLQISESHRSTIDPKLCCKDVVGEGRRLTIDRRYL